MVDKVNTALQQTFDEHGIVCPYPTQSVILTQEKLSAA
jgi:small-conductance mechanosensitive channel